MNGESLYDREPGALAVGPAPYRKMSGAPQPEAGLFETKDDHVDF
jgi:hypothetical protein